MLSCNSSTNDSRKLLSKNVHIFTKSYQIIKIKGVDINAHDVIKTVCGEVLIIVDDKTKSNCNETGYNQTKKIMSVAILKKVYFIKIPRVFCSNQFNFNIHSMRNIKLIFIWMMEKSNYTLY